MPFPTQWCQYWFACPINASPSNKSACLFWFQVTGTVDKTDPLWTVRLAQALDTWSDPWRSIMYDAPPIHLYSNTYYYLEGGTVYSGFDYTIFPTASNILPLSICCCVRRETGFIGQSSRGHVYLNGLTDAATNGMYLTPGALHSFELAAISMTTPFSFRGALFVPSLCSYSRATLTPIVSTSVRGKISTIIRRSRVRPLSPRYGFVPKTPPP